MFKFSLNDSTTLNGKNESDIKTVLNGIKIKLMQNFCTHRKCMLINYNISINLEIRRISLMKFY